MSDPQETEFFAVDDGDDDIHRSIYDRTFWLAYLANVCLVTANALTFRFAELVAWLGGSQKLTGEIVSIGIVSALAARLFLGQAIDRYGARRLWLLNSVLFSLGCFGLTQCGEISALLYGSRILFAVGLAGMFTSSIVHIQNHVPAHRRTEVLGILGSSGFLGMVVGSQLGDAVFRGIPDPGTRFNWLFGLTFALGLAYTVVVLCVTRHDTHRRPYLTPAAHRLILRYWPGMVVLVAGMMGIGFCVTTVFLTRFATHRGLDGIGTFFTAYAVAAFVLRMLTRHWSRTVGRHRMIVLGLSSHCVGYCILPWVTADWHFIPPAIACGFGHALLFPAVISLGAGAFPRIFRGTGTTLVLGFVELGSMASAPVLGWIIDRYQADYGFTPMFLGAGGTAALVAVTYGLSTARRVQEDLASEQLPSDVSLRAATVRPLKAETDRPTPEPCAQLTDV